MNQMQKYLENLGTFTYKKKEFVKSSVLFCMCVIRYLNQSVTDFDDSLAGV